MRDIHIPKAKEENQLSATTTTINGRHEFTAPRFMTNKNDSFVIYMYKHFIYVRVYIYDMQ